MQGTSHVCTCVLPPYLLSSPALPRTLPSSLLPVLYPLPYYPYSTLFPTTRTLSLTHTLSAPLPLPYTPSALPDAPRCPRGRRHAGRPALLARPRPLALALALLALALAPPHDKQLPPLLCPHRRHLRDPGPHRRPLCLDRARLLALRPARVHPPLSAPASAPRAARAAAAAAPHRPRPHRRPPPVAAVLPRAPRPGPKQSLHAQHAPHPGTRPLAPPFPADRQNSMADYVDLYDSLAARFAILARQDLNTWLAYLSLSLIAASLLFAKYLPWRFLIITTVWTAVLSLHPNFPRSSLNLRPLLRKGRDSLARDFVLEPPQVTLVQTFQRQKLLNDTWMDLGVPLSHVLPPVGWDYIGEWTHLDWVEKDAVRKRRLTRHVVRHVLIQP
ncbi:hypothetical protein NEOLI_004619 [Neolecta irregularis DAH-3]|uniref:TECPR1-like DysF domain-containing protein n=1 Tax=Neolecta irregularis (strain DAH-3) TaxID=1198029 RepID=A0A1U7LMJ6_NEOID|nr:hypothetical protein NEOLI_004619 [Neolecta irregularis DAH-3]|eukprot:OLL23890.1 hypothetical protein NEOLI_004619 [Neolecta irregularis DAH-3]